jgi:hypothetical protein
VTRHRAKILELASRSAVRVPCQDLPFAAACAPIVFGTDDIDEIRDGGVCAGWLLKGARPANLLVQQPTLFQDDHQPQSSQGASHHHPANGPLRADDLIE